MGQKEAKEKIFALRRYAAPQPQQPQRNNPVGDVAQSEGTYNPHVAAAGNGFFDLIRNDLYALGGLAGQAGQGVENIRTGERWNQSYEDIVANAEAEGNNLLAQSMVSPEERRRITGSLSKEEAQRRAEQRGAEWEKPFFDAGNAIPELQANRDATGSVEQFVLDMERNAPQFLQGLAGPVGGTAMMAANIAGQTNADLRRKGYSQDAAMSSGLFNAAVQTPMESFSMGKVTRGLRDVLKGRSKLAYQSLLDKNHKLTPEGRSKLKDWIGTIATESGTEFVQEYPDAMTEDIAASIESGTLIKDLPGIIAKNTVGEKADENLQNALYAGLLGGVMGGTVHGVGTVAELTARKLAGKRNPTTTEIAQARAEAEEEIAQAQGNTGAMRENDVSNIQNMNNAMQNMNGNAIQNTNGAGAEGIHPRANAVIQFLSSKGLSPEQAAKVGAAMAGNIYQESGYDTTAENEIGAYGSFQFLGDRRDNLLSFAENNGLDPSDFNTQLEYAWHEMNREGTLENRALQEMLAAKDVDGATLAFRKLFERPGEEEANDGARVAEARNVYDKYTQARQYLIRQSETMDINSETDEALFGELERIVKEGTEEEVIAKAEELGFKAKQQERQEERNENVRREAERTKDEVSNAPQPAAMPQGQSPAAAKIETQASRTAQPATMQQTPTAQQTVQRERTVPQVKRNMSRFNNRGNFNGRLDAPQNRRVESPVRNDQGQSAPILRGENQNAENLQTQTTQRGEGRENIDVYTEPQQTQTAENETASQNAQEVTPILAPSGRGVSNIAKNTPKIASGGQNGIANKVNGEALERATENATGAFSGTSGITQETDAKVKENAALDRDGTVSMLKKATESKVRAARSGDMPAKTASAVVKRAHTAAKKRLDERLSKGEISEETYGKLSKRVETLADESLSEINNKNTENSENNLDNKENAADNKGDGVVAKENKNDNRRRTDDAGEPESVQGTSGREQERPVGNGNNRSESQGQRPGHGGATETVSGLLTEEQAKQFNSIDPSIRAEEWKDSTNDLEGFCNRLNEAKEANEHGAFVDSKTPDKLAGAKVAITSDRMAGVAVKADGDIVAVFKHPEKKAPKAIKSIMTLARAMGGTKGDCFGIGLVGMYERIGLVPVAKIPFYDGDIAKDENGRAIDPKDQILLDQRPDVFVLMTNGDDFATATKKIANNEYPVSTQEELDALPVFANEETGYTDALEYRDALLAGDTKKAERIRSEKAEKTVKEEIKAPQDESQKAPQKEAQKKPKKTKAQEKADAEKDAKAKEILTKDAHDSVYAPIVNVLEQAQPEVAKAARDTALLMAKTAEILHKRHGMKYKDAPRVLLGGNAETGANEYFSPAFDVSTAGVKSVSQFMKKVNERRKAGEEPNKIRYTGKYGVLYTEEQVTHATRLHRNHALTPEQMNDIEEHLNILHNVSISNREDAHNGLYNGTSVLCRIDGKLHSYYVVLEVTNSNGMIWFKTGMPAEKGAIDNIIAEHSAGLLSYKDAGSTGQNDSAISIESLPEALGIVKKDLSFNQPAWHGSPYTFDAFDLSKIGNGEGHQVHGWGLYFAEDRKVSEDYKNRLCAKTPVTASVNGVMLENLDKTTRSLVEQIMSYGGVKEKAIQASNKKIKEYEARIQGMKEVHLNRKAKIWEGYIQDEKEIIKKIEELPIELYEGYIDSYNVSNKIYRVIAKDPYPEPIFKDENGEFVPRSIKSDGSVVFVDGNSIYYRLMDKIREKHPYIDYWESVEKARNRISSFAKKLGFKDSVQNRLLNLEMVLLPKEDANAFISALNLPKKDVDYIRPGAWSNPLYLILEALYYARNEPVEDRIALAQNSIKSKLEELPPKLREETKRLLKEASPEIKREGIIPYDMKAIPRLYEVNVPENDVLLNEQRAFSEQTETVKNALNQIAKEIGVQFEEYENGKEIYYEIWGKVGGAKEASMLLNTHGIKGIKYRGDFDGDCFVIFDDKAVTILNTYEQQVKEQIAGLYNVPENLIKVFTSGNASTVLHESAHWYLTTLENLLQTEAEKRGITGTTNEILKELAEDGTVSGELVSDLQKIRNWGRYSEEVMKEYKGTELEKEFNRLAEAVKNGDEYAEERFIQERFARAYERYLASGKAPAKELQGAFNRFRKWLLDIYKTIKNLGNKPAPKEIQDVFDRMLAMNEQQLKIDEAVTSPRYTMDTLFSVQGNKADAMRRQAKMIPDTETTDREKGIVAFGRKMGATVVFFEGNKNLHGWQSGDVIFLNRDSAKDLNQVFWHESFHWLKRNNSALYEQLEKAVLQNDDIAAQVEAWREKTGRTDLTEEEAIEEMLADAMGDASKRGTFFEMLGVTHPTLVQKIIRWLKNAYRDLVAQFRHTDGFKPEAGLTNTQINRMSVALDNMALKLVDGNGNKLFSTDGNGNLKTNAVEDARYADGVKYLVTNKNLKADDVVKVVGLIDNVNPTETVTERKTRVAKSMKGKSFKVKHSGTALYMGGRYDREHFAAGISKGINAISKVTIFSDDKNIKNVIRNSIYVEEEKNFHTPESPNHFAQFYAAVKVGEDFYRIRISAIKKADGTYMVDEAKLYHLSEEGLLPENAIKNETGNVARSPKLGNDNLSTPSRFFNISVADLLDGVKDRNGKPYVKNGELQYEPEAIADTAEEKAKETEENNEEVKLSVDLRDLSEGQVFRDEEKNQAAKAVTEKMEIGQDSDIEHYLGKFLGKAFRRKKAQMEKNVELDDAALDKIKEKRSNQVFYGVMTSIMSPSRIKDPIFKSVFTKAEEAKRTQNKLYSKWTEKHKKILDLIENAADYARYVDVLLSEDAQRKVFTDDELREMGCSNKVIDAHKKVRALLKEIRAEIAKVYLAEHVETKNFATRAEADAWAKSPFFKDVDIKQMQKSNGVVWQVKYTTPQYTRANETLFSWELEKLQKDGDVYVMEAVPTYMEETGETMYSVRYLKQQRTLADLDQYLPHFFHDFLIIAQDKHGKRVVGSGTTLNEAVQVANGLSAQKENEGIIFSISPKGFSFEDGTQELGIIGDKNLDELVSGIKEDLTISLDEAREAVKGKGKHVFLSALQHRKGAKGWETNLRWVIQHHVASSARYCGLEPFKSSTINTFERAYGSFEDNYLGKNPKAEFMQGYINSILGMPTKAEQITNAMLSYMSWFEDVPRPSRAVTSSVLGVNSCFKLGASMAAAFVNLTQFINLQGYIGNKWTYEGMRRTLKKSPEDMALLEELGTHEETGLETVDVSDETALLAGRFNKELKALKKLADISMTFFTKAESFLRSSAILGAYHKAIAEGKTKGAARAYALKVNRNVNFNYGVEDEPRVFRALKGSIVGDLFLQFKKYGMKEMEVIVDMVVNKSIPKKQKVQFFGEYILLAGMFNALPFQEALMDLLGFAIDSDDPEAVVKEWIMEKSGDDYIAKKAGLTALYGVGGLIGIDISQRVGFRSLVPELDNPLGVTGSTITQVCTALSNGDPIGFGKAISPAIGNTMSTAAGYNTDSKGRVAYVYKDPYERAMRFLGFRTIGEATSVDKQRIITERRKQREKARKEAKEAYLENPTYTNKRRLKDLGYTEGQIKNMKSDNTGAMERTERLKSRMTKQEKKDYKDIMDW